MSPKPKLDRRYAWEKWATLALAVLLTVALILPLAMSEQIL